MKNLEISVKLSLAEKTEFKFMLMPLLPLLAVYPTRLKPFTYILRTLAEWGSYNRCILEAFLNHQFHEIESKEPKEKKLGKIVSLSCLFSLWGLLSTIQTRLPLILVYLMLLYTSRASGASPLELSVSSLTACYSYFSWFFFSVPVFQFMMSEYPILIKSAKGRLGIKHFKIGH